MRTLSWDSQARNRRLPAGVSRNTAKIKYIIAIPEGPRPAPRGSVLLTADSYPIGCHCPAPQLRGWKRTTEYYQAEQCLRIEDRTAVAGGGLIRNAASNAAHFGSVWPATLR
jgi:hypothetical protein